VNRILVVRVGALGDTLMVTPTVRALKKKYPDAEIDFLCSESAAPLLELNPLISHLYRIRRRNLPYALSLEKRRLASLLNSRSYDISLLFETAPRYHGLLVHAGIRRIGGFREIAFDPAKHCIVNYLTAAGFPESSPEDHRMDLPVSPSDEGVAEQLIGRLKNPRIGLHLGYGPRGKKKNQSDRLKGWERNNFLRLSSMLIERGASLVFTGSAGDQGDIEYVCRQLPQSRICSTAGSTRVRELAAVLKKLDLFISVDTGPAHMAAAIGVPLIVLWGPAIYEQVRPIAPASSIKILRVPPSCAPCYGTPRKDSCRRNLCMESITPDSVLEAAASLISGIS
jgi:ADP-heptose:LPS heptosyltransferase